MALHCLKRETHLILALDFVKNYLKVDHDDDDEIIQKITLSAQNLIEDYTGHSFSLQTWKLITSVQKTLDYHLTRNSFGAKNWLTVVLPKNPVRKIEKVELIAPMRNQNLEGYEVLTEEESTYIYIDFNAVHDFPKVAITFIAGYEDPESIPIFFRHAILLTVSEFYQGRDKESSEVSLMPVPPQVRRILQHKVMRNRIL